MSHHAVPAGSLPALPRKFQNDPVYPRCRLPTAAPRSLISCFALRGGCPHPHIPAATKAKCWSRSPIAQTNQGLPKCSVCHPDLPQSLHCPHNTPASGEAEDMSPGGTAAKQVASPHPVLKEQTKLEGRA